jgi:hypothetical protein
MPSESESPAHDLGPDTTSDVESAALAEVQEIAEGLKAIQERLRVVQESLPVAPDRGGDGDDEMDTVTEVRSVIDCVLVDSIGPAVRDLLAVVAYARKRRRSGNR